MFYMWMRYGKPDASMSGNGLLAGLVAITAPSGFVNTVSAVIIGLIAGVLVCLAVEFVDRKMGSEREFVGSGILRDLLDFPKNDVFGVGHGHAFRFQE